MYDFQSAKEGLFARVVSSSWKEARQRSIPVVSSPTIFKAVGKAEGMDLHNGIIGL